MFDLAVTFPQKSPNTPFPAILKDSGRIMQFWDERSGNAAKFLEQKVGPGEKPWKFDETSWELEPLIKLVDNENLMVFKHDGFWHCMDTPRDKKILESYVKKNTVPPWFKNER